MKVKGTIFGVLVILLAIVVYWLSMIAVGEGNPSAPSFNSTGITTFSGNTQQQVIKHTVQNSQPSSSSNSSTNLVVQTSTPTQQTQQSRVFSFVSSSSLGTPISTSTGIMVISSKSVMILDSNFGTKTGKQLAYTISMLYSSGVLRYFVSGDVFRSLSVGEKLKVTYDVYENNLGVTFPVVMNVSPLG